MLSIEQQLDSVKVDGVTYVNIEKLHKLLGMKGRYRDWINSVLSYGFELGKDYIYLSNKDVINNDYYREIYREIYRDNNNSQLKATRARYYYGTINMCKELCMISKCEKGREIRRYYIELENKVLEKYRLTEHNTQILLDNYRTKAETLDRILESETFKPISCISQNYNLAPRDMNSLLRKLGIIKAVGGEWVFNTDVMDNNGYCKTATGYTTTEDGKIHTYHYLVWSERGRQFINEELKKVGLTPIN